MFDDFCCMTLYLEEGLEGFDDAVFDIHKFVFRLMARASCCNTFCCESHKDGRSVLVIVILCGFNAFILKRFWRADYIIL